jgi:hypothetical protein
LTHEPQSQQNDQAILWGPQNEFVHWDIVLTGYGIP